MTRSPEYTELRIKGLGAVCVSLKNKMIHELTCLISGGSSVSKNARDIRDKIRTLSAQELDDLYSELIADEWSLPAYHGLFDDAVQREVDSAQARIHELYGVCMKKSHEEVPF